MKAVYLISSGTCSYIPPISSQIWDHRFYHIYPNWPFTCLTGFYIRRFMHWIAISWWVICFHSFVILILYWYSSAEVCTTVAQVDTPVNLPAHSEIVSSSCTQMQCSHVNSHWTVLVYVLTFFPILQKLWNHLCQGVANHDKFSPIKYRKVRRILILLDQQNEIVP